MSRRLAPNGEVSEQVLLAAKILGIDEIYRVGGAQAVAGLALGTDTLPRVDKICGPGNAFVAEAKKQLYGEVGIDMLAGPSEIVVYADHSTDPDWVAADLMAQAEHDEDTRVTLLAASDSVLRAVRGVHGSHGRRRAASRHHPHVVGAQRDGSKSWPMRRRQPRESTRSRRSTCRCRWRGRGRALSGVRNAGAIFLGGQSPVAVGDYYAGPNHVLPTGTTARFSSCLSVEDFMKRSKRL